MPAVLALVASAVAVMSLLFWSADRTDGVSFERQEQLVTRVLEQSVVNLALEQESINFKDNSVLLFTNPIVTPEDVRRVDGNWGAFLHTYLGHDESYVLNRGDMPLYAMRDGRVEPPAAFESIREATAPLAAELRARMRRLPPGSVPRGGNVGVNDIAVVNGHPAILSLTPVVSPTGLVAQERGKEVIHVSVLRLDGRFLENLSHDYLLGGARFAWSSERRGNEASRPFVSSRSGRTIGYFMWRPYAPGSIVMNDMVPPLLVTLLIVAAITWLLLLRIKRSTVALQTSEAQARHLAFHDVLTGLPNRALFDDRLDRALANVRRHREQKIAVLCLDLDRFKKVNDTLGHPAGDELIRELARRLRNVVRETDTVARLGGDEFAIVATGIRSQGDVDQLCERIIDVVNTPFDVIGSAVFVGMSIGVARSGLDGFDRAELLRKADIALFAAKNAGRGRFAVFAKSMDATIQFRQSIEQKLRAAMVSGDQLEVHYQPQYDAVSGDMTGVEALVRWNQPDGGLISPATFIPIAEESGLIVPLGKWVMTEACSAAVHLPVDTVAVNVSAIELRSASFVAQVVNVLRTTGLAPSRLELEITETAFLDNIDQCEANLKALRDVGVRIALDDFGTGYSSFSHLSAFNVDRLKIDRSFTDAIESSSGGSAIIEAIVSLARSTGLKITAEGVETVRQSAFLRSVGCDELQGFLMSHPMSLDAIDKLLGVDPRVRCRQMLAA